MVGKNLSHYKILDELGRGGMGIVYKGEDTKLHRTVAIKVLPAAALSNEDDRARFYREARAAASLSHPNIAVIHEIDEAVPEGSKDDDLRPFIAMEFIEGETLEDRIKQGPMKLEQAVRIAGEMAEGLKAAHSKDIVHRDIKAANVMLDNDGRAKILDFGLAQTAQSTKLTRMGSTLGTVAYMSPEQARGEEVDARTDIWALGVTLYEMIAGRHPFGGDYEQAVVYSIMNEEPEPLTAVRTGVPMELERITKKCIAKAAKSRYQSTVDLLVDLENAPNSSTASHLSGTHIIQANSSSSRIPSWAGYVGAALLGMLAFALSPFGSSAPNPGLSRSIAVEGSSLDIFGPLPISNPQISPDGSAILFRTDDQLWVKKREELWPEPLPGSFRGQFGWLTSESIHVIRDEGDNSLRDNNVVSELNLNSNQYSILGRIGDLAITHFALRNGQPAFRDGDLLKAVSPDSDEIEVIAGPIPGWIGPYAVEMPGDAGFLVFRSGAASQESILTHVQGDRLDSLTTVFSGSATLSPRGLDDHGFLLYVTEDVRGVPSIWGLPMSFNPVEVTGNPVDIEQGTHPSVSSNGALVYRQIAIADSSAFRMFDASGASTEFWTDELPGTVRTLSVSPDESQMVMELQHESGSSSIWMFDLTDRRAFQPQDVMPSPVYPVFSPNGESILYYNHPAQSQAAGHVDDLYVHDLNSKPSPVFVNQGMTAEYSWSIDGNWILHHFAPRGTTSFDLYRTRADGSSDPELMIEDENDTFHTVVQSPDGEYIAYQRADRVWVAEYPTMANKQRITDTEARRPKWRGDYLYWVDTEWNLVRQRVTTNGGFSELDSEEVVLNLTSEGSFGSATYDVSADGQTVYIAESPSNSRIVVVDNWLESVDGDS